jgi:hypothetical protein
MSEFACFRQSPTSEFRHPKSQVSLRGAWSTLLPFFKLVSHRLTTTLIV